MALHPQIFQAFLYADSRFQTTSPFLRPACAAAAIISYLSAIVEIFDFRRLFRLYGHTGEGSKMCHNEASSSMDYSNRMTAQTVQTATTFRMEASAPQGAGTAPSRVACQNGEDKAAETGIKMLPKHNNPAGDNLPRPYYHRENRGGSMAVFCPKTAPKRYTKTCCPSIPAVTVKWADFL